MTARIILINFVITTLLACSVVSNDKDLQNTPQVTINQTTPQKPFPQKMNSKDYASDQVIVKFVDGTGMQAIKAIEAEMRLEIIKLVYKPNVYLMKILDDSTVESVIERLGNYREVKYSEPNYIRRLQ